MTLRPIAAWDDNKGELIEIALKTMAVRWPREQRLELFNTISNATFPRGSLDGMWIERDRTAETRGGVPFHQLFVKIQDSPGTWFRNLKLLQIRYALGLDCFLTLKHRPGNTPIGEVVAKIQALEQVVGKDQINKHRIPPMRKASAIRDFPSFVNLRAVEMHQRGMRLHTYAAHNPH